MLTSEPVLEIERISVRYGHVEAVTEASLRVLKGQVVALLGSNGAGKSSLLRSLSGIESIHSGSIALNGETISGLPAHRVTRAGLAHVPEGRRVVAALTVAENLEVGAHAARRRTGKEIREAMEAVYSIFPRLGERKSQPSGLMSGGEQQMLAIGRALMSKPDVLMLDEPSMGLAPIVIKEIYERLDQREGTIADVSILLAEQSAALALSLADHVYVLARGRVVFDGLPSELSGDAAASAYLGGVEAEGENLQVQA
jgi:branched-chain amino acid transport system ATP-binding protein